PGGPVIVLQSGEATGAARLPYLQKGVLAQLAQATHGIAVVLEHRYYGASWPVPDLSPANMRFLTTAQALADEAYFARHVRFPGLERYGDLTSATTAYIGYGGSYAGAFSAFLRVLYPDVFWGAISSSGVVEAIWDYWAYYEPVAEYGPPDCIATQKTLTHVVDNILIGKHQSDLTLQLKTAFGFQDLEHDADFASVLAYPMSGWQSLNWDPSVSSPAFNEYCANISSTVVLYPETEPLRSNATKLITAGGYTASTALVNKMLNLIGYSNLTAVSPCAAQDQTQDQCFSNYNTTFYRQDDLSQTWRSWPYQYCTEWGYLQTGSGVPSDQLPLISRLLDLEYDSVICVDAFNVTTPPDVHAVNKYGGYNISHPRLAFIDGEQDPWRPASAHGFGYGASPRVRVPFSVSTRPPLAIDAVRADFVVPQTSTASQPFVLIRGAGHHWDENGLFANETTATDPPPSVANAQKLEVRVVREWMREWALRCLVSGRGSCSRFWPLWPKVDSMVEH
ncbi:hypothetical protein LTR28_005996, partial [Elasticomyces elasticus]